MKLFSTFAVGVFTVLTVVSYPSGLMTRESIVRQQSDADLIAAKSLTAARASQRHKASAKFAQVDVNQLLGQLQKKISADPTVPGAAVAAGAKAQGNYRGIKKVEVGNDVAAESQYSIPAGDIFLDRGAVGEERPADETVK